MFVEAGSNGPHKLVWHKYRTYLDLFVPLFILSFDSFSSWSMSSCWCAISVCFFFSKPARRGLLLRRPTCHCNDFCELRGWYISRVSEVQASRCKSINVGKHCRCLWHINNCVSNFFSPTPSDRSHLIQGSSSLIPWHLRTRKTSSKQNKKSSCNHTEAQKVARP